MSPVSSASPTRPWKTSGSSKPEARRTAPATASTSPAFSVWRVPPTIRNRNNTMSALTKPVKEADSTRPSARTAPVTYTEISESRSEEHTSELQSLMRISYAVCCLKKKTTETHHHNTTHILPT